MPSDQIVRYQIDRWRQEQARVGEGLVLFNRRISRSRASSIARTSQSARPGRSGPALALDADGKLVVLDGDPFKLYYRWAEWRTGAVTGPEWQATAQVTRRQIIAGDLGFADLVLYSDPGEQALRGRKEADLSRTRRNFERNTAMRPYFRQWYEAVGALDQRRVIWEHPVAGLTDDLLAIGPRPSRADPQLFDALVNNLHA